MNQLKDPSTELSKKYYEMEVENHRLYSSLCSAPDVQEYDFCTSDKISERTRLLVNITSSKIPLTTIQMMEAELEKVKADGEHYRTLNEPPKSFSNGVSISASQRNRDFAKAVLQIFEKDGDTSFETLLKLAIEEYQLPDLFDRRSYANR